MTNTAGAVSVFARTSLFRNDPPYSDSTVVPLAPSTADTATLLHAVKNGLKAIYRPGINFAKAGVCLLDIEPATSANHQLSLFGARPSDTAAQKSAQTMSAMDEINKRYGRSALLPASALHERDAIWAMRQERKTPAYTTDWGQIVEIRR